MLGNRPAFFSSSAAVSPSPRRPRTTPPPPSPSSRPRLSSRQAGQTSSVAFPESFAPHFPQTVVPVFILLVKASLASSQVMPEAQRSGDAVHRQCRQEALRCGLLLRVRPRDNAGATGRTLVSPRLQSSR